MDSFLLVDNVAFECARTAVAPLEVRFAHPVRLPPDTHSQGHGRPCLQRLHLRRGFIRHMVFPDGFSVTCDSRYQIWLKKRVFF